MALLGQEGQQERREEREVRDLQVNGALATIGKRSSMGSLYGALDAVKVLLVADDDDSYVVRQLHLLQNQDSNQSHSSSDQRTLQALLVHNMECWCIQRSLMASQAASKCL